MKQKTWITLSHLTLQNSFKLNDASLTSGRKAAVYSTGVHPQDEGPKVQIYVHVSTSPTCSKEQTPAVQLQHVQFYPWEQHSQGALVIKQKTPQTPLLGCVVVEEFRAALGKSSLFLSPQQETPRVTQRLELGLVLSYYFNEAVLTLVPNVQE